MSSKSKRSRPTKEQVRAWLSSVVAPLLAGLGLEVQFLTKNNPTFRVYGEYLEFLSPVAQHLPSIYAPNLLQFWRFYPKLEREASHHDELLVAVHAACRGLYQRLVTLPALHSLAAAEVESKLPTHLALEEYRKHVAEYVINDVKQLERNNTLREFWAAEGAKFLALREEKSVASDFHALVSQLGELRDSAQRLLGGLVDAQERLADRFGLPPVDPHSLGSV